MAWAWNSPNGMRDAAINALVKTTGFSGANCLNVDNLRIQTSGGSNLAGSSGNGLAMSGNWSAVTSGTSTYSQTFTPYANGTAANIIVWNISYDIATGTISTTGGGGQFIISSSLTFSTSTAQTVTSTFKIPLNNGGTLKFSQALATAWANHIIFNGAMPSMANGGIISFYNGTQPADADTAISGQTLLGTYSFATADFTSASAGNGSCPLAASKTVTPSATNTAQFFRWTKAGGFVIDGTVGTTGTDCIVDNVSWTSGVNRSMTGLTLTLP